MSASLSAPSGARKWQHGHLVFVVGLLGFECITGLSIWLLPFSVANQIVVLLHTLGGLAFIGPYAWYQFRHWRRYRERPMSHIKLTGYFSMVATIGAGLTGLVLTYQALFETRISYAWSQGHLIATLAMLAAALPHIFSVVLRDFRARHLEAIRPIVQAEKQFGGNVLFTIGTLLAVVGLLTYAYVPVDLDNQLPEDYALPHGPDSAFAPSLARTITGDAIDARLLGNSQSCGSAGCHKDIYDEWAPSAHRYAAMDPLFRSVQKRMGEQKGSEATRYCGGCHDPISLFSGSKNLFKKELTNPMGYNEGVSCVTCHAIKEADVKGNAAYVIDPPERYLGELRTGVASRLLSDFLIRAYPEQHVESFQRPLYKTPEYCGTCHKQFIDETLNDIGWVQLQNQYDNWRKSRWNHPGDPTETVECRECHMPLTASSDPAQGDALDYNRTPDDGKHRSHRFLATNQLMPKLLDLPGAEEHTRLTEQWIRGEYEIPEIADKWTSGPVVPVEVVAPDTVAPGEEVEVRVMMTNNKAGHHFPTGPLDMIQAWVELRVEDEDGNVLFTSGTVDDDHFVDPGSFAFKGEPVDQYGNLIDMHNLWEMVGSRYSRTLFPGFSDQARYRVSVPARTGDAAPTLRVHARLQYRKVNQAFFNALLPDSLGWETAPITTVEADEKRIVVASSTER